MSGCRNLQLCGHSWVKGAYAEKLPLVLTSEYLSADLCEPSSLGRVSCWPVVLTVSSFTFMYLPHQISKQAAILCSQTDTLITTFNMKTGSKK